MNSKEEKLLKIGELAKLSGVSVKALHVYEKKDIIKPVKIDENTGYFEVYDGAAIFENEGSVFLYRYDSGTLIKLFSGSFDEYLVSESGGNLLYGNNGLIYILTKESEEPVKISSYDNNWKPLYIII